VCAECHTDRRAPRSTPTPLFVSKFNHALHLKLGNIAPVIAAAVDNKKVYLSDSPPPGLRAQLSAAKNACEACHRGLERSDAITKGAFPAMADCLVCHNKIDPPYSCEQCHTAGPQLKPASHTPEFFESHSTAKLPKTGCAVCHGRNFTCQGCH
jgi:hypothetical protein